jgi:OOP family OmpA-OmpF porin
MVVNVTALPGSVITNTATIDSDETASTTVTDTTDVGAALAVDYDFKGKGGGSATGPVELFMLAFGMGFLLLTRRKKGMTKRISALSVVFVLGSIMASTPVVYADTYLGASAGTANADYNSSDLVNALPSYTVQNVSIDDNDTGWKVFGGYEFTPNWAIEAAYVDLGEITTEFSATLAPDDLPQFVSDAAAIHPYMASGFALTGVGKFDISQTVVVFGKIGLFNWDAEGNVKETGSGQLVKLDDSGTNLVYGLGISYEVSPQFGIRAEWESYDVDWDKINLFSVGVEYRF